MVRAVERSDRPHADACHGDQRDGEPESAHIAEVPAREVDRREMWPTQMQQQGDWQRYQQQAIQKPGPLKSPRLLAKQTDSQGHAAYCAKVWSGISGH